ncbi:MAG: hypothetical protein AAGE05_03135 [Pseudomonadota bacterium]
MIVRKLAIITSFAFLTSLTAQLTAEDIGPGISIDSSRQLVADETSQSAIASGIAEPVDSAVPCCLVSALTPVILEVLEPLSSRHSRHGDTFRIALAEPIIIDDQIAVPAGTEGLGEVVHGAGAGAAGRAGELILAARYLDYTGTQIALRSFRFQEVGDDNQALATGIGIAAGLFAFAVSGGNIDVEPGARGSAMIRQDTFVPVSENPADR